MVVNRWPTARSECSRITTTTLSRHLEVHPAIVIHLDCGLKIELGKWNLLPGLVIIEHPERSTSNCVIPHFFNMLIAKNQCCLGLLFFRSIARFDIGLQPVDLSAQRLHIALQSAGLRVGSGIRGCLIRGTGIRILIFVFRVIEKRIIVRAVGIISRVPVIGVIAPSPVEASISAEASMIVEGVSGSKMIFGAVTKTSAMKRDRGVSTRGMSTKGMSGKSAMRGEMGAAATAVPLCPHGQGKQNQTKRRYGQPAPHKPHYTAEVTRFQAKKM
jgi:hypothetical protein